MHFIPVFYSNRVKYAYKTVYFLGNTLVTKHVKKQLRQRQSNLQTRHFVGMAINKSKMPPRKNVSARHKVPNAPLHTNVFHHTLKKATVPRHDYMLLLTNKVLYFIASVDILLSGIFLL